MQEKSYTLTSDMIERYAVHLKEQERSSGTIKKYMHDIYALLNFLNCATLTRTALIDWKGYLIKTYAPASVNSMLAAVNGFFAFAEWRDLTVKPLRIQKSSFRDENKELSRSEYNQLVRTAEHRGEQRLSLILQTICATGIRISELQFITVEAVRTGRAEVNNKGKHRPVFLPDKLCRLLRSYIRKTKKVSGPIFTTRTGKPLDRSNIWRDMKALCKSAGVAEEKVFPHNLRHLFAQIYYSIEKDLSKLADILGHSSVNTTRIYTAESGRIHRQQMDRMGLVLTATT